MTREEFKKLVDELEETSSRYYGDGSSPISDEEWDEKKKIYDKYCKEFLDIELKKVIEKRGKLKKYEAEELLGTLKKTNNVSEVVEWAERLVDKLGTENIELVCSEKIDGNSAFVEFDENGCPISAFTRGKDGYGKDVLYLLDELTIFTNEPVIVRFEVTVTDEDFERLNNLGLILKNNRSAATSIMSRSDGKEYFPYLSFVPLGVSFKDKRALSREKEVEIMENMFLNRGKNKLINLRSEFLNPIGGRPVTNIWEAFSTLDVLYEEYNKSKRFERNFMVDGLVIEVVDPEQRKLLGWSGDFPNYACALKFDYLTKESTIIDMEFDVGKSMFITPCAIFEPIDFFGNVQQRVSLSNYGRFKELGISKGDKVLIEYRNDVISYIQKVVEKSDNPPFKFPTHCPICGEELSLSDSEKLISCLNEECEGRYIGKLLNYLIKLDLKGFKEATITTLFNREYITFPDELYHPDLIGDIKKEFGEKTAENFKREVADKREFFDYQILGALGIKGFGRKKAKQLCKEYSFSEVRNLCESDIQKIDGFGKKLSSYIVDGLSANTQILDNLEKYLKIKKYKDTLSTTGISFKIVITGDLKKASRTEFSRILESKGHRVIGSVSSKTDYLVTNTPYSGTKKNKRANELSIPIISEEEAWKIFIGEDSLAGE